jgi:threonine dehydratase
MIRPVDRATPLEPAPEALHTGGDVFLKREDVHELGAFKWRGALPAVEAFRLRGARGVVTASTGNHGAATGWAARRLGLTATVFVPKGASRAKVALIASQGAEIQQVGEDMDAAKEEGRRFAASRGLPFFQDGEEPAQYAGYGAIAREILEQLEMPPGTVIVPVGNGALIGGIGEVFRERSLGTAVVGAVAREAPVMEWSHRAARAVPCDRMSTFADGLAVRVAIPHAVDVLGRVVDRMDLVSEREIARAVGRYAAAGIRVEGAAGAALAVLEKGRAELPDPVVLILTGRNIDDDLHRRAVEHPESFPGD